MVFLILKHQVLRNKSSVLLDAVFILFFLTLWIEIITRKNDDLGTIEPNKVIDHIDDAVLSILYS
jgi:hypothetical protein